MGYDARASEIEALLEALPVSEVAEVSERTESLVDQVDVQSSASRPDEKIAIKIALSSYKREKDDLLSKLVQVLDQSSAAEAWESVVKEAGQTLGRTLALALHEVKTPTITALAFVERVVSEEQSFYDRLASAKSAGIAMDAIRAYNSKLAEQIKALEDIFRKLEDEAAEVMRDEDAIAEEIKKLVDQAAEEMAQKHVAVTQKLLMVAKIDGAVEVAVGVGSAIASRFGLEVSPLGDAVIALVKDGAEYALAYGGKVEVLEARFKTYFESHHDALLIMFDGSRQRARDFKNQNDYQILAETFTQPARSSLEATTSSGTSGQRADAKVLISPIGKKLDQAEQLAREQWDSFVRQNQGRFFGPLGPDLDKALMGSGRWKEFYSTISAQNLQQLLENWTAEGRKAKDDLDLNEHATRWEPDLLNRIRQSLDEFAKSDENLARTKGPKQLAEHYRESFEKLVSKYKEVSANT